MSGKLDVDMACQKRGKESMSLSALVVYKREVAINEDCYKRSPRCSFLTLDSWI